MATGITTQGTITADGGAVTVDARNAGSVAVQITGTWTATLAFQASVDGSNFFSVNGYVPSTGASASSTTANGQWAINTAGFALFRVVCTAYTSGTATVNIGQAVAASSNVSASITADTEFPAAAALADNTANPTTTLVGACLLMFDGTTWDRAPNGAGTAAAAQRATLASDDPAVTALQIMDDWDESDRAKVNPIVGQAGVAAGAGAVGATVQRVVLATDTTVPNVSGDVAHDGVNSGNPVQIGVEAIAHGTNPTAVAAGDRTKMYANRAGVPFHIGGHPNVVTYAQNFTGAQTDAALVTVSTGTKIVVTGVMVCCSNANSVNVSVRIGFGTANVPAYGSAGIVASHPNIPAGGGFSRGDGSGILGIGADNEDLRVTCSAPTSGSVDVVVTYYTIES